MDMIRLGRTGLYASKVAMGCLPIQRVPFDDAARLVRFAFDHGVTHFDTAHVYTDSEEKMGKAFEGVPRDSYTLASKAMAKDYDTAMAQIDQSLKSLRTDYIDIYQWHNPARPMDAVDDEKSVYQALVDAKKAGKIRFIGISNHKIDNATWAAESGLYDTVQYPFSMLSTDREIELTRLCAKHDVGFFAMKAMCGGLIEDGRAPFAFMSTMPNVVPLWGVQRISEIEQFLALADDPPAFDDSMRAEIQRQRDELGSEFCRGCGYCMPCPAGIELNTIMRIEFFVKRNDPKKYLGEAIRDKVKLVESCVRCNQCMARCPYGLQIPDRIRDQYSAYMELYRQYHAGEELKFRSRGEK